MFIVCVEPPIAATLVRTAPGLYQMGSVSGPLNQMIAKAVSDAFHQHLRESGVMLLPSPVSWSLSWALRPEQPRGRRGLGALADGAVDVGLDDGLVA